MLAFILIGLIFITSSIIYLIREGSFEKETIPTVNQDGISEDSNKAADDTKNQNENKEDSSNDDYHQGNEQNDTDADGETETELEEEIGNEHKGEAEPEKVDETEEVETNSSDEITMVFTGDIYIGNTIDSIYQSKGIDGVVSKGYRDEFQSADFVMINQEFPFSLRGEPMENKQYTFRVKPDRVSLLKDLHVSIVSLANNHTLDYGMDAFLDTFQVLEDAEIEYAGAGRNLSEAKTTKYFEIKDKSIAVLSASRVIPVSEWNATNTKGGLFTTYDPTALLQEIEIAREQADYVVVYVHWGIENKEYPEGYQRTMGKQYIDAGADIVIGSHPHVLQGFEYYKGKPIIYSLGNFIFNPAATNTALLKVTLDKENNARTQIIPGNTVAGYTKEYEESEDIKNAYEYLESISYQVDIDDLGYLNSRLD